MWTTRVILWIRKADKKALLELHFSKNRKYLFCLSEVMRWRKHVQCHCIGICERFIIQRLRCEFLPSFCRSTTYVQINTKWFVNFLLCRSQQELWTLWTQTRTTEIHIYIIRSSEFVLLVVCGRISEQILWRKNRFSSCLNGTDRGNAPSAPAHFTELFICSCNLMKRKIDRTYSIIIPIAAWSFRIMLYGGETYAPENRCVGTSESELKCNSHGCVSAQKNKWKIVRPTTSHSGINLPERFLRCGARRYDFQQSHNP